MTVLIPNLLIVNHPELHRAVRRARDDVFVVVRNVDSSHEAVVIFYALVFLVQRENALDAFFSADELGLPVLLLPDSDSLIRIPRNDVPCVRRYAQRENLAQGLTDDLGALKKA